MVLACDYHLRYDARFSRGLANQGAEVTLLTRDHDGEFGGEPGAARRFVSAAIGDRVELLTVQSRVRSPRGWAQVPALRRKLRAGTPIVHLQESIGNDPRLVIAAGTRHRRFALTVHDPVRHPGDSDSRWAFVTNRALVKSAGLIFTHGDALRDELVEIAAPKAPIVVVPHGIFIADQAPLPAAPSILFFGRISEYKGLDVLLDAMAEVWAALPEAALTVAGAGEIAPHPALGDSRVTLRQGHLPDDEVPGLFEAATVVALPYLQASQSGVGSLAKAHSRALVVSDVGGLPELVADGSGRVVAAGDSETLAETLVPILRDPELAAEMGVAGAASARRESSWDVVAERTLAAYREYLTPRL